MGSKHGFIVCKLWLKITSFVINILKNRKYENKCFDKSFILNSKWNRIIKYSIRNKRRYCLKSYKKMELSRFKILTRSLCKFSKNG
jgi:hypothetical protein